MTYQTGQVRVRFAPSPTGHLHIGGLRTALFNWLFARHCRGEFLLRIEDTDLERSKSEFTESILESLAWCSLDYDEPLVVQSKRKDEHVRVAQQLVAQGSAYQCFCTQEELRERLGTNAADGDGYAQYDGRCRKLSPTEIAQRNGQPFIIRCKVPRDQDTIVVHDLIRGEIRFPIDTIDDFVLVRTDGSPMYNFVVVVDDAHMKITHVIRGEEHLVNTPKQIILYQACGYAVPAFAHLPLILGADGQKLSKRHAATAVIEYKKQGLLADALCNYLIRLGWAHGDQEIFSREEMIRFFTLDGVGKTGAIFDSTKLLWVNSMYLKMLDAPALINAIERQIDAEFRSLIRWDDAQLQNVIDMYKGRVKTLIELHDMLVNLFRGPELLNQDIVKQFTEAQWKALDFIIASLQESEYTHQALELAIKTICQELQLKMPDIAQPIRFALTGTFSAPGIYDLLMAVGREESVRRLEALKACRAREL